MFSADQDAEIARRYHAGETLREIAATYGVSHLPVINALKRQGIARRKSRDYSGWDDTPEARAEIVRLFDSGESVKRIAKAVRTRDQTVSMVLHEAGREPRLGGKWRRFSEEEGSQLVSDYLAGASLGELARRHETSTTVVRTTLRRMGVASTYRKRQAFWTSERNAWLIEQWESGRSQTEIGAEIGYSQGAIARRLRDMGVVLATPQAKGPAHHSWKGGRVITGEGYVKVKVEGSDIDLVAKTVNGGYVLEHRLVMARALGRPLRKTEQVHHINGAKTDNRLENLQLRQGAHGSGVRMVCIDCGSHNIEARTI